VHRREQTLDHGVQLRTTLPVLAPRQRTRLVADSRRSANFRLHHDRRPAARRRMCSTARLAASNTEKSVSVSGQRRLPGPRCGRRDRRGVLPFRPSVR
jgi:hypothetical protein